MKLIDIIRRLKAEAPTGLTLEEELHLQAIEMRRRLGHHMGTVLMEEGVNPDTLRELQPDADVMQHAMHLLRDRMN